MLKSKSKMRFSYYLGFSKQSEIIFLSILGIICTIFDASLLEVNSNLHKIWDTRMDPAKFSERITIYMKYLLSGIVLIRTFTIHLYLGCYIILLYPAFFEDRPGLILPWLMVSTIKCLLMGFLAFSAGFYTCVLYDFMQPTCWEFLLTQILDHAPSIYMFFLVLSYYRDLKHMQQVTHYIVFDPADRRRRLTQMDKEGRANLDLQDDFSTFNVKKTSTRRSRSLDSLMSDYKSVSDRQEDEEKLKEEEIKDVEEVKPVDPSELPDLTYLTHSLVTICSQKRIEDIVKIPSEVEVRTVYPEDFGKRIVEKPIQDIPDEELSRGVLDEPQREMTEEELNKEIRDQRRLLNMPERRSWKTEKVDNALQVAEIEGYKKKSSPRTTLTKPALFKEPGSITTTAQMEGGLDQQGRRKSYIEDGYTKALFEKARNMSNLEEPSG